MAWPTGDPVVEIDGLILRHRQDQRAQQHLRAAAVTAERQALGAMQAAQAIQVRAERAEELDEAEINRLFDERAIYLPVPRSPAE